MASHSSCLHATRGAPAAVAGTPDPRHTAQALAGRHQQAAGGTRVCEHQASAPAQVVRVQEQCAKTKDAPTQPHTSRQQRLPMPQRWCGVGTAHTKGGKQPLWRSRQGARMHASLCWHADAHACTRPWPCWYQPCRAAREAGVPIRRSHQKHLGVTPCCGLPQAKGVTTEVQTEGGRRRSMRQSKNPP